MNVTGICVKEKNGWGSWNENNSDGLTLKYISSYYGHDYEFVFLFYVTNRPPEKN